MSGADLSRNEVMQMVVRVSLVSLATYFSVKWYKKQIFKLAQNISVSIFLRLITQIDPTCKAKQKAKERASKLLKR